MFRVCVCVYVVSVCVRVCLHVVSVCACVCMSETLEVLIEGA